MLHPLLIVLARAVAQAAAREPVGVTLGASIGHAMCTGVAVIGGCAALAHPASPRARHSVLTLSCMRVCVARVRRACASRRRKLLASSISERTVLLVGGVLFCIFAVLAVFGLGD